MLNFKIWINEQVQLLKKQDEKLIHLGRMAWWDVYAVEGLTLDQTMIAKKFEEAAHRLSFLGFKKMNSVVLIKQHSKVSQVTGGPVAGTAYFQSHGFTINPNIDLHVLIHEHAHMAWKNLPKSSKKYFAKWHQDKVSSLSNDELWNASKQYSMADNDKKNCAIIDNLMTSEIEKNWIDFKEKLEYHLNTGLEEFLFLRNSQDNQKIIKHGLLNRHGKTISAIAKKPMILNKLSGYGELKINPGDHVRVFYVIHDKSYLIEKPTEQGAIYDLKIHDDKIHDYVEFDDALLYPQEKDQLNSIKALAQKPLFNFLANKPIVEKAFNSVAERIARYLRIFKNQYSADQLFHKNTFYGTWAAMIRLRYKKGKLNNIDGVKEVYLDAMKRTMWKPKYILQQNPKDYSYDIHNARNSLDKPEGKELRNLLATKHNLPSDYAAANVDELWAETVANSAMHLDSVSKELKQMLFHVLSGVK